MKRQRDSSSISASSAELFTSLTAKLFACLFIMICLALGVVGVILPIIPGLLFFALAAMIAANLVPGIDRSLRRSKVMSRYLDSSQGFFHLNIWEKAQYLGWLCIKIFIDSIVFIVAIAAKCINFTSSKYRNSKV